MTRREQDLVDQMRHWRSEIDARPEPEIVRDPPERELEPRSIRLARSRTRRLSRVTQVERVREPYFVRSLVRGPAEAMEVAWQSGTPIGVRGADGELYPVVLEHVTKPNPSGMVWGHPKGTSQFPGQRRSLPPSAPDGSSWGKTRPSRAHGWHRGARSR